MSNDEFLRQQTQNTLINNPYAEKPTSSQVPDVHDRQVIQNEMDRIRREQDERARQQS
jgi:hypothetical protein